MSSHDKIVAKTLETVKHADRVAIIHAFVGSLSSRNLPARSAFGSYVVLQKFEAHPYQRSKFGGPERCAVCGLPPKINSDESEERVAKYPFQVRHTDVRYAAFDLATFGRRKVDEPTQESIDRLNQLLDALRSLPGGAQLTQLEKSISKAIKSNKFERMILLETLATRASFARKQSNTTASSSWPTIQRSPIKPKSSTSASGRILFDSGRVRTASSKSS